MSPTQLLSRDKFALLEQKFWAGTTCWGSPLKSGRVLNFIHNQDYKEVNDKWFYKPIWTYRKNISGEIHNPNSVMVEPVP